MKDRISQRFKILKNDIKHELFNPKNFQVAMNMFMVAMVVLSLVTLVFPLGFADDTMTEGIKSIAFRIYTAIAGVSTALAVVGESIAASMYFFSSNGKTVEAASGWMKRIGVGWIFINAMGIIVSFFTSLFSGEGYIWKG